MPKHLSIQKKSSNVGFPTGRDSTTFWDNGTDVSSLSTKGQRDKGPGHPKSGTGRGTKRDRAEKDVLKQEMDVLKQERVF